MVFVSTFRNFCTGAKLWQLGWFAGDDALQIEEADLPLTTELEGFVHPLSPADGVPKVIKINRASDSDLYLAFNWASGFNAGADDNGLLVETNSVNIVEQGGEGRAPAISTLLASLGGESRLINEDGSVDKTIYEYTYPNYFESGAGLLMKLNVRDITAGTAEITFMLSEPQLVADASEWQSLVNPTGCEAFNVDSLNFDAPPGNLRDITDQFPVTLVSDVTLSTVSRGDNGPIRTVDGDYPQGQTTVEPITPGSDFFNFDLRDTNNNDDFRDLTVTFPATVNAFGFHYFIKRWGMEYYNVARIGVDMEGVGPREFELVKDSAEFFGLVLPHKVDSVRLFAPEGDKLYMNIDDLTWA